MQVNIANHKCTICWDGVYYFALSDYPNISPWELKKLLAFMDYEKRHGRQTEIICEDKEILSAVNNAIASPVTVENAALPTILTECTACIQKGCLTRFVCHTAAIDNAKKILKTGKLSRRTACGGRQIMFKLIPSQYFIKSYKKLPKQLQKQIDNKLLLLAENPNHPSLRTKRTDFKFN